jgi:hypothetical protein
MKFRTLAGFGAVALAALLSGACGDGDAPPTGPQSLPSLEVVEPPVWAEPLMREMPLAGVRVAVENIGPEGGEFGLREVGLRVTVPPGAVSAPTRFWVTALPGDILAYEFGPHGARFAVPLRVEQSLRNTNWGRLASPESLEAGYFASWTQIDNTNDQVLVNEFLPVDVDVRGSKLRFNVEHFSGYMVSSGRKPSASGTTTSEPTTSQSPTTSY